MNHEVALHDLSTLDEAARAALTRRAEDDLRPFLDGARTIVEAVRAEGDVALIRFAREFDKAPIEPGTLRATDADFARAHDRLEPEVTEAIRYATDRIRRFHERAMPEGMWLEALEPGSLVGERHTPIPSVACYVPRGKGAFPSMTMMTLIPAVVAGVRRILVLTPPGADGGFDDATLVAADIAGVREVYKVGGAQAVAAAAFGTETVPRVAKIVGPGSPWVAAGKRLLAGEIDTGPPAGPTESIVLADETANPLLAALDLIIESEHGDDSSCFLVTDSVEVAERARAAIPRYWERLGAERRGYSSAVLGGQRGGIVLAPGWDAAIGFVNDYAPEHLQILSRDPFADLEHIVNAGEVLLGPHTPSVLANFALGPNAVLPTSGAARTHSPLSVFDFLKRTGVGYVTAAGYPELARQVHRLARYEGFEGHALAISEAREKAGRGEL